MKPSWTRRGKKTYQPIRTEFSTRRSVNSVYKETEDTHTHTSYTHQCYDEDADEDYYEDN